MEFIILLVGALVIKVVLDGVFFKPEIQAALKRDPAAQGLIMVSLLYSGFHAIQIYRLARLLHQAKLCFLSRAVSQIGRWLTGIEIHPAAKIGRGLFIDHGMGVVIGETAVIGDNVTIYQGVTLGGTGMAKGKRHPTIGNDVVIGSGAKVLGNIVVGDHVFIGANAVVVRDVPNLSTVVGVPGRITSREGKRLLGINLDHTHLPDPLSKAIEKLQHEIDHLENEIKSHREETPPSSQ